MIDRMLGAIRLSSDTYEEVEKDRGATLQALAIVILVSIAGLIGSLVGSLLGEDDIKVVNAVIVGVVRGVASWALWALVTWIVGATILKTERTEADWGELARCTGFAQTPGILNVFSFVPIAGGLIFLVALIWRFAAMIVGVRQALDYTSTWRAFFVILIAAIPVFIVNGIVFWLTGGGGDVVVETS